MADFVTAANAMRAKLAEFTALPLFWPNDPRDASGDTAPDGFVYSEIVGQDERPVSLGAVGFQVRRDYCEMRVYVYVPSRTKVGTAEGHAQQIRAMFGVDSVAGVKVTRKILGAGEALDMPQGRYFAVPIIIEFFTDRTE